MNEPVPYTIAIADQQLDDLKTRLQLTRWPDKETPEDWTQGIPLAYMKEIHDYWLNEYDWRSREALLNTHPQFQLNVDDLDIHFIHVRSPVTNARPLLMTHGWPGSIVEFQKVIGPLTDPEKHGGSPDDAFHLVCPSLPGFGFSGKPTTPGWNIARIAAAWNVLMTQLGYEKYYAQGGDWGAIVTTEIGVQNLGNCQGIHITMPIVGPDPATMDSLTDEEKEALRAAKFYQEQDSGYSTQQRTRPQTLGYGLADSPIGQAAWILEKFYQWMDCEGHPENIVSRDELLDNVMLYWLPDTGASSARIYWESMGGSSRATEVKVPSGISLFPKEIFKTSERWARQRYTDLRYFNNLDKGGHFAAFEQPVTFVREVQASFNRL